MTAVAEGGSSERGQDASADGTSTRATPDPRAASFSPGAHTGTSSAEFAHWVRPSLLAMTRLAKRLAPRADPDDIVQDSLLRAWQRWSAYDAERGSPTTWLLAIVADKARDARVARLRRLRVIDDGVPPPDASAAVHVADVDLDRAISRLPTRQALAVHLYYFVGLSVAETGQVMDCSAGTVKSTLFDARENLRKTLGDCDD